MHEPAAFDSDCLRQARQIIGTVNIVLSQHRRPYELCALARAVEIGAAHRPSGAGGLDTKCSFRSLRTDHGSGISGETRAAGYRADGAVSPPAWPETQGPELSPSDWEETPISTRINSGVAKGQNGKGVPYLTQGFVPRRNQHMRL